MSDRRQQDEFEEIDIEDPIEGEYIPARSEDEEAYLPAARPGWAKAVAWSTVALGVVYLINPTAGVFELLPDNLPIIGNLDEAGVMFLVYTAMRYLGVLPEFLERWMGQYRRLPPPRERKER